MKQDRLELLASYSADDIQAFLKARMSETIPEEMQRFILQLDAMAQILHYHRHSQTHAVEALRKQWPTLTIAQARGIYRDALEYFYQDPGVSARVWDLKYADAFDDLARVAIAANKYAPAFRAIEKAHALRTMQREQEGFKWQAPTFFVNINVKPEDLGYASQKLADIARRHEDAELKEMITSLETTGAEKQRLLMDAGIEDVEPIEEAADEE